MASNRRAITRGRRVTPSLYAADPMDWRTALREAESAGADGLHFDVMDGCIVPQFGLNLAQLVRVAEVTDLPIDVHLMTTDTASHVQEFLHPNVRRVFVHPRLRSHEDTRAVLAIIRDAGVGAGVALSPDVSERVLEDLKDDIGSALIMSCPPGVRGAKYLVSTPDRLLAARSIVGPDVDLVVDGALDRQRIEELEGTGADVFVVGRAFFAGV